MLIDELLSDCAVNELLVALGRNGVGMREHEEKTAHIAFTIAAAMKLGDSEIRDIALGGLLHEVGKLDIPYPILFKPAKLNGAEAAVMRTYPYLGYGRVHSTDLSQLSRGPGCHQHRSTVGGRYY